MSTESTPESADTDESEDSPVDPSATSQQDEPTTDQASGDEGVPTPSGHEETDEPTPTGPPETFRAAIQSEPLKNILRALRATVDEARVKIDESGIRVRAVDPGVFYHR